MTFASIAFLVFLPLVFGLYWLTRSRLLQNVVLVAASAAFYAWWDVRFCGLMLGSAVLDFFLGLAMERQPSLLRKRILLAISVAVNLGLLGFFKYSNFFADNLQALARAGGWSLHPITLSIVLPAGISFYTFQTLGYIVDVYRGSLKASRNLVDYLGFVTFFPQLVAGPIERAGNLLLQFQDGRRFDYALAVDGSRQILWGLFKKALLADTLGETVDAVYATPGAFSGGSLALATVFFAFQIYCDFSAYSDIASGTARLFGFRLMRNFAYPYFAQSLPEFWRRWHISLSTWFRDYLYVPLGGARVGRARLAFNILLTFIVSGFWHGAHWTFILWGALHGIAMIPFALGARARALKARDIPGGEAAIPRPAALLKMACTFGFICLTWVFFRAKTAGEAGFILARILRAPFAADGGAPLPAAIPLASLAALLGGFVLAEWVRRRDDHALGLDRSPRVVRWMAYTALAWGTLILGAGESRPFIYFQF